MLVITSLIEVLTTEYDISKARATLLCEEVKGYGTLREALELLVEKHGLEEVGDDDFMETDPRRD